MIIRAIRLVNFGVYAGSHLIEPAASSRSSTRHITLIGGMNGAGKSSLVESVLVALYGDRSPIVRKRSMPYSSYLQGLVSRGAPRGTTTSSVELDMEMPSGQPSLLRIRRSWQVRRGGVEELLQVWCDGVEDPFLAESWNSYVEDLMPTGLVGLFFFDGEDISVLAESEHTPDDVREAIRFMLGLSLVQRLVVDLDVVIRRNRARVKNSKSRVALSRSQEEARVLLQRRDQANQDMASLNCELARLEELIRRKRDEYLRSGGLLNEHKQWLSQYERELSESEVLVTCEMHTLAAGPLPLLLVRPVLQRARMAIAAEQRMKQAKAAMPLLAERNRRLLDWLREQPGALGLLKQVARIVASQEKELEQISGMARERYPMSPVGIGQLDYLLDVHADHLLTTVQSALRRHHELGVRQDRLERRMGVHVDAPALTEAFQELLELGQRAEKLREEQRDLASRLVFLGNQISQVRTKLEGMANVLVQAVESERIIHYALRSQSTMRAFAERLACLKVGRLADTIKSAFDCLSHKADLISSLRIDPRTLEMTLADSRSETLRRSQLSAGERQMLAVSILWGLAQASGRALPVIVDAALGRLDSSHRRSFVEKYLPAAGEQVIVFSTDTELVGPYLDSLRSYVGRTYLLQYDPKMQRTSITDAYFPDRGGEAAGAGAASPLVL